jgi:hypothetical protein
MALAATVKINNRRPLERVLIPFLDVPPTAKHPVRGHQNRVLREKRCQGDGIVLVNCRVKPQTKLTELTKCLGIPRGDPAAGLFVDRRCPFVGRRSSEKS